MEWRKQFVLPCNLDFDNNCLAPRLLKAYDGFSGCLATNDIGTRRGLISLSANIYWMIIIVLGGRWG